jgi:hypothetical protein
MSLFALSRTIGPVPVDVVVREQHESDLTITSNPVEFGAAVSDHAYTEPKKLILDAVAGSRAGPAAVALAFQALTRLQESREPFDVLTGLTIYRNMLIERITVNRDSRFATVLYFTAELKEVIIVDTETTPGDGGEGGAGEQGKQTKQSDKLAKQSTQEGPARDRAAPPTDRSNQSTKVETNPNTNSFLFNQFFGGE